MAFQVMTGDDWVNQMHDHLELFNGWTPAILYFFNFSFCNFILLSLFIAVILENFEVAEAEKMKMQKEQRKTKIEMEEEERRKPKITFMHRLTFCCGGQGKGDKFMSADLDEFGKSTTLNIHPLNGKILALDDPMGNLLQKALDASRSAEAALRATAARVRARRVRRARRGLVVDVGEFLSNSLPLNWS